MVGFKKKYYIGEGSITDLQEAIEYNVTNGLGYDFSSTFKFYPEKKDTPAGVQTALAWMEINQGKLSLEDFLDIVKRDDILYGLVFYEGKDPRTRRYPLSDNVE